MPVAGEWHHGRARRGGEAGELGAGVGGDPHRAHRLVRRHPLPDEPARARDLEHPPAAGRGDQHVAVGQRLLGAARRRVEAGRAVAPDHRALAGVDREHLALAIAPEAPHPVVEDLDHARQGQPRAVHQRLVLQVEVVVVRPDHLAARAVDDEDGVEVARRDQEVARPEAAVAGGVPGVFGELLERVDVGDVAGVRRRRRAQPVEMLARPPGPHHPPGAVDLEQGVGDLAVAQHEHQGVAVAEAEDVVVRDRPGGVVLPGLPPLPVVLDDLAAEPEAEDGAVGEQAHPRLDPRLRPAVHRPAVHVEEDGDAQVVKRQRVAVPGELGIIDGDPLRGRHPGGIRALPLPAAEQDRGEHDREPPAAATRSVGAGRCR